MSVKAKYIIIALFAWVFWARLGEYRPPSPLLWDEWTPIGSYETKAECDKKIEAGANFNSKPPNAYVFGVVQTYRRPNGTILVTARKCLLDNIDPREKRN